MNTSRSDGNPSNISRRTFLASSGVAGLGLLAAACGGTTAGASGAGAAAGGGSGGTGMAQFVLNNTCLESLTVGAQTAWKKLGAGKTTVLGFDGSNSQQCLSQVQVAGARGIKMVATGLADDALWAPYMESLGRQKIYGHSINTVVPWQIPTETKFNGYCVGQLFSASADEAYHVGKILFEKIGKEGDVIQIKGIPGTGGEAARSYGYEQALKEYPGIKVVAAQYANWDRVKAENITKELVQAHPSVRGIIANNDSMGAGCVTALRALGKTMPVSGADGDPPFVQMIADNDGRALCTAAARCDLSGMYMAVRLFDTLKGVKYSPCESLIIDGDVLIDTPEAARKMIELVGDGTKPPPYDARLASRYYHPKDWQVPWQILVVDPFREWSPGGWTSLLPGYKPPAKIPADVPQSYLESLKEAPRLNKLYAERNSKFFKPVQDLSNYRGPVAYTLPLPKGVPAPYTPPPEWQ